MFFSDKFLIKKDETVTRNVNKKSFPEGKYHAPEFYSGAEQVCVYFYRTCL